MTQPDKDLQKCLDRAVEEWLKESGGGMVTGSMMIVDFVDSDGDQMWAWSVSQDQHMTVTMGLVEWMRGLTRYEQRRHLDNSD